MNKNTILRITAILALTLGAGALQAQPAETDAPGFSQNITTKKKELYAAGRNFGLKLGTALKKGSPEDLAAMKATYVDALIAIARAEEDWQATRPPTGMPGKELHAAFRLFLQNQRQTMQTDGLKLIRIVEDNSLNAEEKTKRVLKIINAQEQAEKKAEVALEKIHKAFREEHKIK